MQNRVSILTSHLADIDSLLPVLRARQFFNLSDSYLRYIQLYMEGEMEKGLRQDGLGTLPMLPSYVLKPKRDQVNMSGVFYAIDMGGTNLRVLRIHVDGKGSSIAQPTQLAFEIPVRFLSATAAELFNFIGNCVAKFTRAHPDDHQEALRSKKRISVGFTFSFPTIQKGLAVGQLLNWTKGFKTTGMEGANVVQLLQRGVEANGIDFLQVVALCNDTVGTLIAKYLFDPSVHIGCILGTGSNACYWEKVSNIKKYTLNDDLRKKLTESEIDDSAEMVVNIEWGNLGSDAGNTILKTTPYDKHVDNISCNPGRQRLEKMISGYYIGELVRYVLRDVFRNNSQIWHKMQQKDCFPPVLVSRILTDESCKLRWIHLWMMEELHINVEDLEDRRIIKEVCVMVRNRSATLAATALAAILKRSRHCHEHVTIAIDGSVYEKMPGYKTKLSETMRDVYGIKGVNLTLSKDGSGIGAAYIAAIS
uniref:Phosphotransferase n=1 Tax=Perkinsela sp. SMB-60 TaxID=1840652 RepID=A0A167HD48_9EUGL|nr:hexokinase [Perkinsela sp. SMB-60]